jgi:hypothetical protein
LHAVDVSTAAAAAAAAATGWARPSLTVRHAATPVLTSIRLVLTGLTAVRLAVQFSYDNADAAVADLALGLVTACCTVRGM